MIWSENKEIDSTELTTADLQWWGYLAILRITEKVAESSVTT